MKAGEGCTTLRNRLVIALWELFDKVWGIYIFCCRQEPWWELNPVECYLVQSMRKRAKKNFIFWWLITISRLVQNCTKIKYKMSKTMMSDRIWQQFDNKIWENDESLWSMTNFRWKDTGLRMKSKLIHWINDWYAWQQEHFLELIWEELQSNAIKLCTLLIAHKFLCYFLCFLYIFTCISHTPPYPFLSPVHGIVPDRHQKYPGWSIRFHLFCKSHLHHWQVQIISYEKYCK